MVSTRRMALTVAAPVSSVKEEMDRRRRSPSPSLRQAAIPTAGAASPADYERLRGERIKENMERLRSFGILDLSLQLKSHITPGPSHQRRRKREDVASNTGRKKLLLSSTLKRRSSRLQNVAPVSYVEINPSKEVNSKKNRSISIEVGAKEEVYTDEHEKLLGTYETGWTLFVDGFGTDGKRIYDSVIGKTCHQCRQKTLGHRTHCSECQLIQGQFCGDCLFMRYGENVLEAKKNHNWICPVCRGICNCSLCRTKKGWAPTGTLYKKVVNLGYKSVAHYLIQTRRQQPSSGDLNSSDLPSAEESSCIDNGEVLPDGTNDNLNEKKSKIENGKTANENESSTEAGVISSPENDAPNAAVKSVNDSHGDVNPVTDSIGTNDDLNEKKSKIENGKIANENKSSTEAGVISSPENDAANAVVKRVNDSHKHVNQVTDSIGTNDYLNEKKSKIENGKIANETESSTEAGVFSSPENDAPNAAVKRVNDSCKHQNQVTDSIASRLRKRNRT
ncbi:uncharacterized protein LOC122042817 isoform X1 [Zingiber officinale]|nr:uncharacterized protein LOC122042817 isoform X1 [Zingiber officinale]